MKRALVLIPCGLSFSGLLSAKMALHGNDLALVWSVSRLFGSTPLHGSESNLGVFLCMWRLLVNVLRVLVNVICLQANLRLLASLLLSELLDIH